LGGGPSGDHRADHRRPQPRPAQGFACLDQDRDDSGAAQGDRRPLAHAAAGDRPARGAEGGAVASAAPEARAPRRAANTSPYELGLSHLAISVVPSEAEGPLFAALAIIVNVAAQVAPIGIGEIYERDLLSAIPVLPLFLSRDGVRRSLV